MGVDKCLCDGFVDEQMADLWDIAQHVHANPEVAFSEHEACRVQCDYLSRHGFDVTRGVGGLETAYTATFGHGEPRIGIVSEYDALPGLGHGCGHNLICATALGTAVAVKRCMEESDVLGTVTVFGTPAEEEGGGKIVMLEKGAFEGIDAIFFMHPTSDLTKLAGRCMSSMRITVEFVGVSAHAGSHPWDGANALSSANLFFAATGMIRQQFRGDVHLSGIIEEGGRETGLIPDYVKLRCSMSSFSVKELERCVSLVENCAKGSALAMGCEARFEARPGYQGRIPNTVLSEVCRSELEELGEPMLDGLVDDFGGEDLGNVSRLIPICNPYVTIFPDHKISGHTEQFRELANSEAGYRCIQVASKAMARSIVDVLLDPSVIDRAKQELAGRMSQEE